MTDDQPPVSHPGRMIGLAAAGAVVAVLAVLLVVSHNKNQAPFTGLQADAKLVGLKVLTPTDGAGSNIKADLVALGGDKSINLAEPRGHRGWQYLVGRVDVADLPPSQDLLDIIVIDNRDHRVAPMTFGYPEPGQSKDAGQGWDGADASLAKAWKWTPNDADQAAFFTPGSRRSLPFYAVLPDDLRATDLGKDVTVVLTLTNGQHVYWSEKLN